MGGAAPGGPLVGGQPSGDQAELLSRHQRGDRHRDPLLARLRPGAHPFADRLQRRLTLLGWGRPQPTAGRLTLIGRVGQQVADRRRPPGRLAGRGRHPAGGELRGQAVQRHPTGRVRGEQLLHDHGGDRVELDGGGVAWPLGVQPVAVGCPRPGQQLPAAQPGLPPAPRDHEARPGPGGPASRRCGRRRERRARRRPSTPWWAATHARNWATCYSMVWACGWRSVDTRTYNAARICGSFLMDRRRRRPAQEELPGVIPPVLPIWLLAGLPPDLSGAPHGWPPTADDSVRRATLLDPAAAAAAAATTPDEAGRSGSSRTCHLRSNHRAYGQPAQGLASGGDPV